MSLVGFIVQSHILFYLFFHNMEDVDMLQLLSNKILINVCESQIKGKGLFKFFESI